jgi:hypothetical protein
MISDFQESKDLDSKRSLTLENGNKIYIERKDPYGFWDIHYDKGQIPDSLKGKFTSYDRAEHAVKVYLSEKAKPVKQKSNGA